MSATQAEMDKEVAALYLARSEGKVIQYYNSDGFWSDNAGFGCEVIRYGYRVKPQTVEEAAADYVKIYSASGSLTGAFILGAKWQKEQGNEH